jgi:hypothetical protein
LQISQGFSQQNKRRKNMDKNAITKLTDELISLQKENTLLTSENVALKAFFDKVTDMVVNPKTYTDSNGNEQPYSSINRDELQPYIDFTRSCLKNVPV